jgi:hypothetical protein
MFSMGDNMVKLILNKTRLITLAIWTLFLIGDHGVSIAREQCEQLKPLNQGSIPQHGCGTAAYAKQASRPAARKKRPKYD